MMILPRAVRGPLLADLSDAFARPMRAHPRRWYWGQVARTCWPPTLVALHLQHRRTDRAAMPAPSATLDIARQDIRFALRGFRRRPFVTSIIVATLSLGIGANTTMFGVLDRLFLEAPPHIADPNRVVLMNVGQTGEDWVQTTEPYAARDVMAAVGDLADVAVATPTAVVRRQYFPIGRGASASQVAGS
ncbi:MAG TPA: hypothetical protein VHV78_02195, partial [Gemmatimonadaceae bacterium]|nr:hypothetical protein [Gemmatimonadaceae bacterium]